MLFISRILVILFVIDLSVRQYKSYSTSLVTAFTATASTSSHSSNNMPYASLRRTTGGDCDEHHLLLDESVLLYSRLKTESTNEDLKTQRKEELTSLIEDVVFHGSGMAREETTALQEIESETESNDKPTKDSSSLDEISLALDEQILLGSQTTFTEEELQVWIANIDSLREKLQSQLIALPSSNTMPKGTTPSAPSLDRLRKRLEAMRASIESTEST